MSVLEDSYLLDIHETEGQVPPIRVSCKAELHDEQWTCSIVTPLSEMDLSSSSIRAIKKIVRTQFEDFLRGQEIFDFHWDGEKVQQLLQLRIGDVAKYKGETCEVVYVVPEQLFCGIKDKTGKLYNKIHFSELVNSLFKKPK